MTSPSNGEPIDFIREWRDETGETWYAIHPLFQSVMDAWVIDLDGDSGLERWQRAVRLVREITNGERRFPAAVGERMLEIDAAQQANGAPDEHLGNLLRLLQMCEAGGGA